jgi:transposase
MSRPEIAIHKSNVMKEESEKQYVRRSSKDYSYSFKLAVVQEIEQGLLGIKEAHDKYGIQGSHTVATWVKKYGNFDMINKSQSVMTKSNEQKLLELEQKVRLLEKQKAALEHQLERTDKKAIFFDMMINIAEEEFKIPIRKKFSPEQLAALQKNKKKP